ncbi:MAG: alpha/beta fold hydrolase [Sedimentisphaerales bacterium]|nr:alpha/beta fold hydrolase [Sedimentisphaerales bacterium]
MSCLKRELVLPMILMVWCCLAGCDPAALQTKGDYTVSYYYTQTEDNLSLALRRYQPKKLSAEKNPVILCHGLSYNLMFWDLNESVSLPRYLAQNGYDVWSLSLRGAAPSTQPVASALRKLGHFQLDPEASKQVLDRIRHIALTDWTVDDHIRKDVPAAIRFVKEQTNFRRVHWIGHSMGGMVMFGFLQTDSARGADDIKSFVALATPMAVFHPLSDPFRFLLEQQGALAIGSTVVGSSSPAGVGVLLGDIGSPTDKLFFNSTNINDLVLRELFRSAQEEISPGQLKQLLGMVRIECFLSTDKTINYTTGLNQVTTPTYFIAGTVDNMATAAAVKYAYRAVGSTVKKFDLFGRVNGERNDYGHDDLVIGENAAREVYPAILSWLNNFQQTPAFGVLPLQPGSPEEETSATCKPEPQP